MPIGQEPGLLDLDVVDRRRVDLRSQPVEHHRRDVDRHDAAAPRRDRERELSGAGAHVDDDGVLRHPEVAQESDLVGGRAVLLAVVPADVFGIEVLATGGGDLVE